jgi:hypothetical protein
MIFNLISFSLDNRDGSQWVSAVIVVFLNFDSWKSSLENSFKTYSWEFPGAEKIVSLPPLVSVHVLLNLLWNLFGGYNGVRGFKLMGEWGVWGFYGSSKVKMFSF